MSDVVLQSPLASRQHGRFVAHGAVWVFEDVGSSNGTFVDGRRVQQQEIDGEIRLRIGSVDDGDLIEARVLRSDRRQQPIGSFTTSRPLARAVRIGRANDNDIVLPDLTISRHHAEIRLTASAIEVVDLSSFNGTYLNGSRVAGARALIVGDVVAIGGHSFRLLDGRLEQFVDSGAVTFTALDLGVRLASGVQLLDNVSFALPPRTLLAVLGPTGAGKSTLLNALTGFRPATTGRVLYAGNDLYRNYAQLRRRLGHVPQEDILHALLPLRRALEYAAELRFPPDTSARERRERIDEVLIELGLKDRAELPIRLLSGGQRKRASIAVELLSKPSLLFLDEPTSGLDPGYQRSLVTLFRRLATDGRTVVVVTHTLQSIDLCDRVLFLSRGGRTAFFGPPTEALAYFGRSDFAEVFEDLERGEGADWARRFRERSGFRKYVAEPVRATKDTQPVALGRHGASGSHFEWARQLSTLVRRYLTVLTTDQRNLLLLMLQAPILALLIAGVFAPSALQTASDARKLVLAVVLTATWLGASNSVRETVKERAIYLRESSAGLFASSYILSKVLVLGLITVAQAVVVALLTLSRQTLPTDGAVLASPTLEILITMSLIGLAGMAIGLLISATSSTPDRALVLLPVILIAQLVLSGGLTAVDKSPLGEVSALTGSRWGFAALAASTDLMNVETAKCREVNFDTDCQHWSEERTSWSADVGVLGGLTLAMVAGAWVAIRRTRTSYG